MFIYMVSKLTQTSISGLTFSHMCLLTCSCLGRVLASVFEGVSLLTFPRSSWGLSGILFPPLFVFRFLEVPGGPFWPQWLHLVLIWEPFWSLLGDFLGVGGISEN